MFVTAMYRPLNAKPHDPKYWRGVQTIPANKGDILKALASDERMSSATISSPRTRFFIEHVRFDDHLTASDIALFELCLAVTRDGNLIEDQKYSIAISDLLRYLGWKGRKQYLTKALERLGAGTMKVGASRSFRDKDEEKAIHARIDKGTYPLFDALELMSDGQQELLQFAVSDEARRLLTIKRRYQHVELIPMARMTSKWSQALYRFILLQTWQPGIDWRPGSGSRESQSGLNVSFKPIDLAKAIGWVSKGEEFSVSEFKREVLTRAYSDLKHLKEWSIYFDYKYGAGRGKPIEEIIINIAMKTPNWRGLQAGWLEDIFLKALTALDDPSLMPKKGVILRSMQHLGFHTHHVLDTWTLALDEAFSGESITPGCDQSAVRGKPLLALIETAGVDDAFWTFICAESRRPDLALLARERGSYQHVKIRAHNARRQRAISSGRWSIDAVAKLKKECVDHIIIRDKNYSEIMAFDRAMERDRIGELLKMSALIAAEENARKATKKRREKHKEWLDSHVLPVRPRILDREELERERQDDIEVSQLETLFEEVERYSRGRNSAYSNEMLDDEDVNIPF